MCNPQCCPLRKQNVIANHCLPTLAGSLTNISIDEGCETSFLKETDIVLPDFNVEDWYKTQEPLFRIGRVSFCEHSLAHRPLVHQNQEKLSVYC